MTDWDTIVTEHAPAVWRTAYRLLSNEADASDCMQEAFVSAVGVARRQAVQNWPALLKRLATTRALDRLRARMRESARRGTLVDMAVVADGDCGPERRSERRELSGRVRQALGRLPGRQAEVFCLRFLSGMSYTEIADHLGLRKSNVGVLLHRARSKLREMLAEVAEAQERPG
ncbi:MAG: sigma-70 family RNA polymerase sigma factor [Phycisphaerae bacterium]